MTFITFGEELKATRNGTQGIVEAMGLRFTGPDDRDIAGEYFTADTDYGPHKGNGMPATLNHRIPMITFETKAEEIPVLQEYARRIFPNTVRAEMTPHGIVARHILDLSDAYEAMIFKMVQRGKLRWSSGAPGHMVDRDESKRITTWHIAEWAYTPIAADPNLPSISPIKSLEDMTPAPETLTAEPPDVEAEPEHEEPTESQPAAETPAVDIAVAPDDEQETTSESAEDPAPEAQSAEPTPEPDDELEVFYAIIGDFVDNISERIGRLLT